jgi:replicative DNA helicase
LNRAGGPAYVASLTNTVPSGANIEYYAKIVLDRSIRRHLLNMVNKIVNDIFNGAIELGTIIGQIQQELFELSGENKPYSYRSLKEITPNLMDAIENQYKQKNAIVGIPSGFKQLDDMTSGFRNSDYIVIGSHSSIEKTALILPMITHIAVKKKIPTAFFSSEMSDTSLGKQLLSKESKVDLKDLDSGNLGANDFSSLTEGAAMLYDTPLYIIDSPKTSLLNLWNHAKQLHKKEKIEVLFIDNNILVNPENNRIQTFNQFAEISKSLKRLSQELNIPIVVFSQSDYGINSGLRFS